VGAPVRVARSSRAEHHRLFRVGVDPNPEMALWENGIGVSIFIIP